MRTLTLCAATLLLGLSATAQWKSKPDEKVPVSESLVRSDRGGLLFGWFDPANFTMGHSYSMSYTTSGGMGYSLGEYTNTMLYQISDPLSVRLDLSLSHSPFDSYGGRLGRELSGFRVSNAELNYRPSENTSLRLQFRQLPANPYLMGFGSPYYMRGFGRDEILDPYR